MVVAGLHTHRSADITVQGELPSLQNSTVRESAAYAVDVDGDATLTEPNNTFANNAAGSIDY